MQQTTEDKQKKEAINAFIKAQKTIQFRNAVRMSGAIQYANVPAVLIPLR